MTNQYVLPLANTEAVLENVGGKGASLARLARAGLPVPDGFHVTTAAYWKFIEDNGLQPRILEILKTVDLTQPSTLEVASKRIGELFSQAETPHEIEEAIAIAYAKFSAANLPVAVRSSATAEDLPDLSFAGQQETFLNVYGIEAVQDAVKRCWASLWTGRAIAYRLQHDIDQTTVSLAVVVQMLVFAEASGVLFTAHPVTGRRDHAMLTAAWGLGEAIVGGLVTPDTLTVEKSGGRVLSREIADKQVMTVRTDLGTEEKPAPENLRHAPVLTDLQAAELVQLGVQIEALYGMPMDIEWALAEGKFAILQARPITALPEIIERPVIEWKLPKPKGVYMRGSIVDLLPDPVSPLFASMGVPAVIAGADRSARFLTGTKPVLPDDYFTTINYYAYMNAALSPGAWWWVVTGMLPAYPRILRMMIPFWRDEVRPQYRKMVTERQEQDLDQMPATELWRQVQELVDMAMYYLSTLMFATMGASAGSEGLLTMVYDKFAKQEGDPAAPILLMGYNSIPVQAEKSLYDLAKWSRQYSELVEFLLNTPTEKLVEGLRKPSSIPLPPSFSQTWEKEGGEMHPSPRIGRGNEGEGVEEIPPSPSIGIRVEGEGSRQLPPSPNFGRGTEGEGELPPSPAIGGGIEGEGYLSLPSQWCEFQSRFQAHLEKFGYIIFELDFAKALPLDHPEPMLETIKMYLRGEGVNPHARQRASEEKRLQTAQTMLGRLKGLKRWVFTKALNWAQSLAEVREDALADIGLGYPLLRRLVEELGSRFAAAGTIQQEQDIFWLEKDEIEQGVAALESGERLTDLTEQVKQRKAFWQSAKQVTPPPMMPPKKRFMGIKTDIYVAASESDQVGDTLKGVGASAGKVTAPARVLHGSQDFDQMRPGDVLVAGATTPAWTPLFAMASAVVTDIGGPLSHGSIVAREYGIPAVMGTGVATRRIRDGQMVTVDGSAGTVTLHSA